MDPLAQPIALLMRPTFSIGIQDSLEAAARKLRENGCGLLPVVREGVYIGAITETALSGALASGAEVTEPVETVIGRDALVALGGASGAEALRLLEGHGASALVVLDDGSRVLGILTPSDLFPKKVAPPRPPLVGGMATPFGVYLTTGSVRAGVGHLALVTTGITLFGMFAIAQVLTLLLSGWLQTRGVAPRVLDLLDSALPLAGLLGGMRLLPLSGIHAAEHKVVHAIERGEELLPAIVRRMPRVHPRCGTNLAVGAGLFLGIASIQVSQAWISELQVLFAGLITLGFWRPIGNMMQRYVTTKRPTEKQIAMGIRSGKELLEKYAAEPVAGAGFFQRVVYSGMLHVMCGALLAMGAVQLLAWALHLPTPVGVE